MSRCSERPKGLQFMKHDCVSAFCWWGAHQARTFNVHWAFCSQVKSSWHKNLHLKVRGYCSELENGQSTFPASLVDMSPGNARENEITDTNGQMSFLLRVAEHTKLRHQRWALGRVTFRESQLRWLAHRSWMPHQEVILEETQDCVLVSSQMSWRTRLSRGSLGISSETLAPANLTVG